LPILTEQKITIARSAAAVFAYVSNMENFSEWFPQVRSITSANSLPHAQVGKEYLEVVAAPNGEERKIPLRVREVEKNRLFVTEGEYPPLLPRMEIEIRSQDADNCVVTWRMLSRNKGFLVRFTLLPLARRVIGARAAAAVARLKSNLEGNSA
jgi:uncharacterized protein YndB with AHSA1/START domain